VVGVSPTTFNNKLKMNRRILFILVIYISYSFVSSETKEKELPILLDITLVNKNIDSLSYDVVKKMCKKRKLDIITLDDYNAMLQRQMGFVLEPYIRDKKGIPNNLYELMSKEPSIAKKMDISFFAESNSLIDSILVSFKNWSGPPSKTYSKTFVNYKKQRNISFTESCIDSCISRKYFFESYKE
jgi:hypothetical protein